MCVDVTDVPRQIARIGRVTIDSVLWPVWLPMSAMNTLSLDNP